MLKTSRHVQIEWGDCDPSGLVFHPRYFAMFDWSLATHFAKAGLPKTEFGRYGATGFPSIEAQAKFLKPLHSGDQVVIETTITEFGRSSFKVTNRIIKDGEVMVEGYATRVWTGRDPDDSRRLKSLPVPDEVKALFIHEGD